MRFSFLLKWADKWRWILFILLLFATLKVPLSDHLHRTKKQFNVVEECKWSACFTWMKSAEVYRETGIWLALKDPQGNVIPYECGSCADDIGHALFLSIISKLFSVDLELIDFVRFNAYINLLGMVALLVFFYRMRQMVLFATLLFMTTYYFLYFNGFYSPHYAGLGLAGFAFLLPLSLLAYYQEWRDKRYPYFFIGLGLVLLAIATLMRSVYGYLGLGTSLLMFGLILWKNKGNFKALSLWIMILFLTVGAWMSPKWTLDLRDLIFHFKAEENNFKKPIWEGPHGISHNLFIGLGIVPNKFGITYGDLEGYEFVKRIDPTVSYTSSRHYEILSDLYFQYLKKDPLEVLRIYYEKGKILLQFPPFFLSALLFPFSLLLFAIYDRKTLLAYLLTGAGTTFFMLQGILAHVDKSYLFPGTLFSFLQLGLLLNFFIINSKRISCSPKRTLFIWTAFFIFSTFLLVPNLKHHFETINQKYSNALEANWKCTNHWIKSSEIFNDTGLWLMSYEHDGQIVPFEDVSLADDLGHAFFLSMISKLFHFDIKPIHVVYFNSIFNITGVFVLALLLLCLQQYCVVLPFIYGCASFFLRFSGNYSPYVCFFGEACFLLILPLSLFGYYYRWCNKKLALFFIALGILSLATATLMRSVMGYFGLSTCFAILIYILTKNRFSLKTGVKFSFMMAFVTLAWASPTWIIAIRDLQLRTNPNGNCHHKSIFEGPHGISHNLYIGLGSVPNKFGIVYSDTTGENIVKEIDPSVVYVSKEYFQILKGLYLKHVKEDFPEVLRIYFEKGKIALKYRPYQLTFLILPFILLIFLFRLPANREKILPFLLLSIAGTFFFLLQGILGCIGVNYIYPGMIFTFCQVGLLLESGWQSFLKLSSTTPLNLRSSVY